MSSDYTNSLASAAARLA
jgi:hypothetical protein